MLLVIDNYDSFTYNLVQAFSALGADVFVKRNDQVTLSEIEHLRPERIVISPGPGRPEGSGISLDVVRTFCGRIPILGVCLGHQCIAAALGASIVTAPRIMHGKTSRIHHDGQGVFVDLPNPMVATRYHSLLVDEATLPDSLTPTARSEHGELMGIRHRELPLEGVQFHPESFLCPEGPLLLRNAIRSHHDQLCRSTL